MYLFNVTENLEFKDRKTITQRYTLTSTLFFGDPINRIISSCENSSILIFDSDTCNLFAKVEEFSSVVNFGMKWDEEVSIFCSDDSTIRSFRFLEEKPHYELEKDFKDGDECKIYRMLKLDEDLLLYSGSGNTVKMISYSTGSVIHAFDNISNVSVYSCLKLSKKYFKTFFINVDNQGGKILEVSYEDHKIRHHYQTNEVHNTMVNFLYGEDREEFLVSAGDHSILYFFNTCDPQSGERPSFTIELFDRIGSIYSSLTISSESNEHYLAIGGIRGGLLIFSFDPRHLLNEENVNLVFDVRMHQYTIESMEAISDEKSLSLVTSATEIHVTNFPTIPYIEKVDVEREQEGKDQKDRILYFSEQSGDYFGTVDDVDVDILKKFTISLRFLDLKDFSNVPKILFL